MNIKIELIHTYTTLHDTCIIYTGSEDFMIPTTKVELTATRKVKINGENVRILDW